MDGSERGAAQGWRGDVVFLRRVLITLGVILFVLLLWQVRAALLLTFAGVVVAALLLALARPIEAWSGLSRTWSLAAVGLALALLLGGAAMLVGGQVQAQMAVLGEQLPRAMGALEQRLGIDVPTLGEAGVEPSVVGTLAGHVASLGGMVVSAASALVLAVVGGFFLAADPALYRQGVLKLLPSGQQARAGDAMEASGEALRLWLIAQFISMVIVGVLAGLGTWALGLPSPLALGLFAGLAGFVPLIGSVAGAVPALLLALSEGGNTLIWTALLFLAIQQVESNMIMPIVEHRMVSLPPATLLFAVVAVGLLFGLPGVLLAAPITVVAFVLVKKLYVRQTLGHPTEVPGEGG
ncbi:AI-2E family transporter [Roseomonas stagni]|uniref:AI-2E family transporter n=1 Tax=Falsiroseomonas algicola TaxID=2716930 RepID=A0A6M1LWJ9_9PROT|nr:AI-2E family transporter [Falsiroseomonas algicola]NGM24283.1 AI-2E family transporter [Falsiroseomonas algicola]